MPDGGPHYLETNLERLVAEPYNASTAFLFVLIALYWLRKLRKNGKLSPFLSTSLVILLVGGMGGTLFHGLRNSRWFLLLDVLPILLLTVGAGIFLWKKILGSWKYGFAITIPFLIVQRLGFYYLEGPRSINASYAILATLIALPLLIHLVRNRFQNGLLVLGMLATFGIALMFRMADRNYAFAAYFPMGTHWLWHIFSAIAVFYLISYIVTQEETT